MFDFPEYLRSRQAHINQALEEYLPADDEAPTVLSQAMRYSIFPGGKRFRPVLVLAAAEAVSGSSDHAMLPAIAIEALHTYSIVHDDLPALDDDDERRGKATVHIKFGEANAILAGDGLLNIAFEWMASAKPLAPCSAADLCLELAAANGSQGIVGGQVEDMRVQGLPADEAEMLRIHTLKTVSLFRVAVRVGAMAAGASADVLSALTSFAEELGMAYQIVDDIDDYATEGEASSDVRLKKMTAVTVYGLDEAKKKAAQCVERALACLNTVELQAEGKAALTALVQSIL
jgi:geranylgeranyl diphosphate synthase type II